MRNILSRLASLFMEGSRLEGGIRRALRFFFWIAVLLPVLIVPMYFLILSVMG